jgi:hypothetical protein
MSPDDDPLPKVTPGLLRTAATMCARRLDAEYSGASGSGDPVNRGRLRDAFLDAARVVHAEGGPPRLEAFVPPSHLEVEEQRVFEQAAGWYRHLFGTDHVTTVLHECDRPTESHARGVRVGGWVDLTVEHADGTLELRQLDLWGGRGPTGDDLLDLEQVWIAVLRLARWAGSAPLRVSWSDLVRGSQRSQVIQVNDELPALRQRLDDGLALIRERIVAPDAQPGLDCGSCKHVWKCPAHPDGVNVSARRGALAPGIVSVTPTSFDLWHRCRRAWRNQRLLSVAASDDAGSPDHGQRLHGVLSFLHEHGSCHDDDHIKDVLESHGGTDRLRDELERHARRCPSPCEAVGHEMELARFHREPWPPFMATARLDAVWVHDGMLDARDYKTGKVWYASVGEDPRALVQAYVLAPLAAARGLRLRIRYEHLATEVEEDPEPWEPDADELASAEERMRSHVEAVHAETQWEGVADVATCGYCRFRSICPDSASAGEPLWPMVDDAEADADPALAAF